MPRVLYINLSLKTSDVKDRLDLDRYLGGTGLATALFMEEVKKDLPPGHAQQPLVIAAGCLAPFYPVATKSVAIFFSPLNGSIGESHAGGRLALAMRLANLDAIVLKGAASEPLYVNINDEDVTFNNANPLWGLRGTETATYIREKEKNPGMRSILRIGPAGERDIAFSMVIVDTYRHFGRLGMGAVFGSKKLKALIVSGSGDAMPAPADHDGYSAFFESLHAKVLSGAMRKYHEYGTAMNILPLNELKGIPTRNLQTASFEHADGISGESFAEHNLSRKFACAGCPLGCIHIGFIRRRFAQEQEWERTEVSYDYELIYALGSLLGVSNRLDILALMEKVEELGIDAIYAGVFLAWVAEALQKGLITEKDVKVSGCAFGNTKAFLLVLDMLASGANDFYAIARQGLTALCARYGGGDFALLANRNAVAGYHTGHANLLGQHLVGVRNSHTDNAGYAVDQEGKQMTPEETIDKLLAEEIFRSAFNCTGLCLFVRKAYDMNIILRALGFLGVTLTAEQFMKLGEEIYLKKMRFKIECGFDLRHYEFPKRFLDTAAGGTVMDAEYLREAREYFAAKIEAMMEKKD